MPGIYQAELPHSAKPFKNNGWWTCSLPPQLDRRDRHSLGAPGET